MVENFKQIKLNDGVVLQNIDDESMVYVPSTQFVHVLNKTAANIVSMIEKGNSFTDIVQKFIVEYSNIDQKTLKNDIEKIISQLQEQEVINVSMGQN